LDGKVVFYENGHRYEMLNNPELKFSSVTGLIGKYHEEFDTVKIAQEVSTKVNSKYYGMEPDLIAAMWDKAAKDGTALHSYGESLFKGVNAEAPKLAKARWVPEVVKEVKENLGYQLAKTELLVYSEALKLAGQSDLILKKIWKGDEDYSYAIYDWKFLSKDIERKSYYNKRTRQYKKMLAPFHHLMDCNWIHYSIQLAIYQTMTGDPAKIREKVLITVYDDRYEFVPCYPMRVFWDRENNLHAVYETYKGKYYDSRTDTLLDKWPADIVGR
jgi:hypothetical protein